MKTINQLIISNSNYVAPAGRVLIAFMFVMSGLNKMNNYSNTAGWMDAMGVPGSLLPLVIVLEVLGGAAIMIGWQTRIAAILFAAFSVMSAAIFHADFSDQNQMIHFMKNVSIAGRLPISHCPWCRNLLNGQPRKRLRQSLTPKQ
jgi:putative oxidoreductase